MNKIFNNWMNSEKIDLKSKEMMETYSDDEINLYFSDEKPSFGTAGIRQKIGPGTRQFNEYTYKQITIGFAKYLCSNFKNPKIIIGHDNRKFSNEFTIICAEVCSSFGIEVFLIKDNELKATPIISFLIQHLKLDGGIIITASHNPKEYNGFKVYKENGAQILDDIANEIIKNMPENNSILNIEFTSNKNLIKEVNEQNIFDYFNSAQKCLINTKINEDKNFPIIFTPHHGTAYKDLPFFLKTLGYSNVIKVEEQSFPDENFINSPSSNPEDELSFELSLKYAEKYNAEILLGVDPDADRLAIVIKNKENKFKYITGNEMGIIFTYYCLKNKKYANPFIVSTYVSTNLIDRIAKDFSCSVYRTGTGFKWLAKAIDEHNDKDFVVAFEEAIGSLNSTINKDKDSFQASALALEIFDYYKKKNIDLEELLLNEIYPKYGYWRGETISFLIKNLNWIEKSIEIMNFLKEFKLEEINNFKLIDNKWNDLGQCLEWIFENNITIKFRKSGTEPKFKAYLNIYGNSIEDSNKNFNFFKNYIEKIINEI